MAKLAHVEGEEFFRVFDLVRALTIGSVVSESLSAASGDLLYVMRRACGVQCARICQGWR